MRIVGGRLRGRKLAVPKSQNIRPTADRVRESLFNILEHKYCDCLYGARVLDVFAGTGALGIEALSRGAAQVVFIENGVEARRLLRQNVEILGLTGNTRVINRDATNPGPCHPNQPFDLVFADPPYGKGLGEKAIAALIGQGWLAEGTLFLLEEEKTALPKTIDGFTALERRDFGITSNGLYRYLRGNA
ncbi:MAG: 16S rRNA (guanine(966)-N(2))-methyltransferase RsmD [Rhizobiaceae bacterium]